MNEKAKSSKSRQLGEFLAGDLVRLVSACIPSSHSQKPYKSYPCGIKRGTNNIEFLDESLMEVVVCNSINDEKGYFIDVIIDDDIYSINNVHLELI